MSSSSESFTIRQEEEIEVLKAIYGDKEVVDLRNNDAWKIPRPPEFTLRVAQNHDSMGEINADDKVTIRVKMSADYPITVPSVLKIYEAKALSSDDIAHLEVDMMKLAQSLVGEVMITEIAQNVGAWLVGNSRKKGPRFGSFYEEMEAEKEKRERKKRDEKEVTAKLESIELESIREEVERKAEALEEDRLKEKMRGKREKEETAAAAGSPQEMGYVRRRAGSLTTSARIYQRTSSQSVSECSADGYDSGGGIKEPAFCQEEVRVNVRGEQVRFDKLAPVGRNVLGGTVYLGNLAGKVLAVSEWPFKTSRGKVKKLAPPSSPDADDIHDAASLLKQIGSVEQELRSIHKLEHPNVVRYLGLTYQQKQGRVNLFVLEEFVYGSNLSFHLSENIAVELDLLRHYVSGVLEALEFMHGHNFVHRDLRDTSVFVESTGRVRVADFSIDKRVRDLWVRSRQLEDKFPMAIGRGGKKMDIYRLGLLTLSLAVGEIVQDPAIPAKMYPPDFQDFLKRCLDKDERERWSATELLEHRWIKNRLERSPLKDQVNSEKRNQSDRPLSPDNDGEAEPAVPFVAVGSGQSRLGSEFSYISDIGKGGFGEVMKVKNNLDGQIYAIKRIHLDSKNKQMTKKLMREVKLLSRLNHENVVRYYTSWIELTIMEAMPEGTETSISMEDEEELESSFGFKSPLKPPKTPKKTPKKSLVDDLFLQQADELFNASVKKSKTSTAVRRQGSQKDWSFSFQTPGNAGLDDDGSESDDDDESSSEDDVFGTSFLPTESWGGDELDSDGSNDSDGDDDDELNCGGGHDDSYVQFESSNKGTTGNQSLMTPDVSVAASDKNHLSLSVESERPKVEIRRMYIQMEYCDRQTLRNAIDDGLYKDMQRLWRMFRVS
jgi:translation initiation factor 2-alpha kinase 4